MKTRARRHPPIRRRPRRALCRLLDGFEPEGDGDDFEDGLGEYAEGSLVG